jgi:hypothetical protein
MSKGISQTASTSDSLTTIPTAQLKKAINIIENAKVMKEELSITKHKILVMDSLLITKDNKIVEYKTKDTLNNKIIGSYKEIVLNLNKNLLNSELSYGLINMKLSGEKRKKWATLVLGVGVGFLIFH